jgi:O-antigen/teichoic acid export membrane protein
MAFAGADIVGHAAGAAYLTWHQRRYMVAFRGEWTKDLLLATAWRWVNLPVFNLLGSFLSLAFVSSPLLIMPLTADPFFAGQVALAFRIFDVPTQIITAASTPIFLNRLRPSEVGDNPVFRRRVVVALGMALAVVYAAVAGAIALADDYVLQGTALAHIAGVVTVVAMFQLFVALSTPLNDSCALYPQQRRLLLVNGVAVACSITCVLLADFATPRTILTALAILSCCRVVALGELLRKLSKLNRRRPTCPEAVPVSAP